ncbi:MAG: hypothetical protein BWX92_04065 [Deltaproteobacteria bacterium ADurb.Bin135]|nr:MAG: hypothetical protein BWX92_04065 [Deltaproteobacteria bacterium ADurb.Bin135]
MLCQGIGTSFQNIFPVLGICPMNCHVTGKILCDLEILHPLQKNTMRSLFNFLSNPFGCKSLSNKTSSAHNTEAKKDIHGRMFKRIFYIILHERMGIHRGIKNTLQNCCIN